MNHVRVKLDEPVTVALAETVPGKTFTVRVEAPADYVPPAGGARVSLKTDDAQTPELSFTASAAPEWWLAFQIRLARIVRSLE